MVESLPELILYKNRSGSSGVMAYALAPEAIFIKWTAQDDVYEYTYEVNGRDHVERMKWLAQAGRGLSAFISTRPTASMRRAGRRVGSGFLSSSDAPARSRPRLSRLMRRMRDERCLLS